MSPRRTASVRLPVAASLGMSRRLFTTSSAVASSPTGTEALDREGREPLDLHVGRAGGGHHAEEHEDEELTEPGVAVGPGPPGVEPRGGDGHHPDPDRATSVAAARASPATAATPKATNAARFTAAGLRAPLATRRTGPTRSSSVPRTPSE